MYNSFFFDDHVLRAHECNGTCGKTLHKGDYVIKYIQSDRSGYRGMCLQCFKAYWNEITETLNKL